MRAAAVFLLNSETGSRYFEAADSALDAARKTANPKLVTKALFQYARSGLIVGDIDRLHAARRELQRMVEEKKAESGHVNSIRRLVKGWRGLGWPDITPVTRVLFEHWNAEDRFRRLFFCQLEAVETLVFITEVAKRSTWAAALIASLPLISILSFIWVYLETRDLSRIADLSAGIFWLVVNAFMLKFASVFVPGFQVQTFGAAFWGAIVLSLVNMALKWIAGTEKARE